jgi:pilus assembly protein CpaF
MRDAHEHVHADGTRHSHAHDHGHEHSHEHDHEHPHSHEHPHDHHHGEMVAVEQRVLARNDELAARNRAWFRGREICALNIVGSPGAGKTTLLAAALGAVDGAERIVCVEDAPELAPRHPHLVRLVARAANVEGAGEVTMRQLVRQALRMRPDRIVVGEVRGAEVVDLLTALNTGHDGGAGTVHANSPAEVPARLEALAALGGLDRAALHSQLAAAVQAVVHVSRRRDGTRRLSEIAVLCRADGGGVCAVTAWHADRGWLGGQQLLQTLIDERRQK